MKKLRFLLTGAAAGFLNGLFGAGGGMVVVPMLQKDGLEAKKAHATSIAIILPLSILSSILYFSNGHLRIMQALSFVPLGLLGALIGAKLLVKLRVAWLHRIFGAIVIYSALRLLLS